MSKRFGTPTFPDGVETMQRLAYMYIYSGIHDVDTLTNRQAGVVGNLERVLH